MNILITGAEGFIGHNLSKHLEKEYNVVNLELKLRDSNVKNQIVVDLRNKDQVRSYFAKFKNKYKIDVIIHLACKLISVNEIDDINILYENLKITENIVEIAKLLKPKNLINFSSIAVYPNKDGVYSEISEIKPSVNSDCLYGLSKFCSENIIDFMLRKENIIISHLRVSQVYGEGMREDRVIPVMLKELEEKNTITVFGNGDRISNFIEINKLLNITNIFLREDLEGIYNIGDENLSYSDLARRLIKRYGDKKSRIIKNPNGSIAKFYLDTTKVKKLICSNDQSDR